MRSFSTFWLMRFGASSEHSTLTLSFGSMLVAHAAFIAVAVAMPAPETSKPAPDVEAPITVEVAIVSAEDEERDPEEIEAPDPVPTVKAPPEPRIAMPWDDEPFQWDEPQVEGLEIAAFDEPEPDLKAIQPVVLDPEKPRPTKKRARARTILRSLSARSGDEGAILGVLSSSGAGIDAGMQEVFATDSLQGGVITGRGGGGFARAGDTGGGLRITNTVSSNVERNSYIRRVSLQLQKNVRYPQSAINRRLEGRVKVAITIDSDGRITKVRVIRGSGDKALDGSVLRHIKTAKGLPKPPKSLGETVRFVTTFRFKLG